VKENGEKRRGATRTNELCIFLPLRLWRRRKNSWWTNWARSSCYFSFVVFEIVFLIISCSSTFSKKQRNIHSLKKKVSHDDHLRVVCQTECRNMRRTEGEKKRFVILVDLIMKMKVIKWIYKRKAGKISSIYHKIHSMKSSYVYEMTFDDRFCKQE